MDKDLQEIISLLTDLMEDRRVPRNVRASVQEAINELKKGTENKTVRINTAISILDEISNDPNILPYTRTEVWNIVSLLEAVQKDK